MDTEKASRYFKGVGGLVKAGIIMLAIGTPLVLVGLVDAVFVALLGAAFIVLGIVLFVRAINNQVSDAEYDAIVAAKTDNMKGKALKKLAVDEDEVKEIAPIILGGYVYNANAFSKLGNDKAWRSSAWESTVLTFSNKEVLIYKYTFDSVAGTERESTETYFYKDVVSVTTSTRSVKAGDKMIDQECFQLITSGGSSLSVALTDVDNAERSINAMRMLLREKKDV